MKKQPYCNINSWAHTQLHSLGTESSCQETYTCLGSMHTWTVIWIILLNSEGSVYWDYLSANQTLIYKVTSTIYLCHVHNSVVCLRIFSVTAENATQCSRFWHRSLDKAHGYIHGDSQARSWKLNVAKISKLSASSPGIQLVEKRGS